jgi:[ribosomal protein S5]-alanine N-acetyltransferase
MLIHTPNLRLLTCTAEHLEAIVRDPRSLGPLLNVTIPDAWPRYPDAYPHVLERLRADPLLVYSGWWLYLFTHPEEKALVGCGGFKAPPSGATGGVVEVGCEIAPQYRGRGFAAEAMRGLIRYAFTRPGVNAVEAQTLPERGPCTRVMEKAGMRLIEDSQGATNWQWRIVPDQHVDVHRKRA